MYRSSPSNRDRALTLVAVVLIHAGLAFAFLNSSGGQRLIEKQADLRIFDIVNPPPPPIVEELPEPERARPREDEGAASPRNIDSAATPVVAPRPRIALPVPVPIVVTETPNIGAAPTQGASPVPGPGTGAGGTGTGTGSGGSGRGTGGGGGGGEGIRATIIPSTMLTGRDYPPGAIRAWPRNARVFVAVRVQLDGRATDCKINRSSGNSAIDADTCRLLEAKARFNPARDDQGRPYVDWYGYVQEPAGRW